jgi:hypothetical protein
MSEPARVEVVPPELLDALAAEAAEQPAPALPSSIGINGTDGTYASRLRVAEWLTDRGVAFTVKSTPDARGRTVYLLRTCPFDPAHGSHREVCVMQDGAGKLSALCMHNGCAGRGWQQFKEAIGAPDPGHYDPPLPNKRRKPRGQGRQAVAAHPSPTEGPPEVPLAEPPVAGDAGPDERPAGLPTIQGNRRQLRELTADALRALLARNDPPTVFQRGGLLTRLRVREETGAPFLEPLTDPALRGVLARVANWTKVRDTQYGPTEEDDAPPLEVVKDVAHLPGWEGVPVIEAVAECPIFTPGGLVASPGFHPAARLWYHPAPGLEVPPVPDEPARADIDRARTLLQVELFGDFPLTDEASRAHSLAALLLPFVRPLVDGPTPLHLLDAPVEGTGKTLLASAIGLVATGRPPEAMAEGSCDEEWRKRLTALLAEAPTFVLLDNLNRALDSGALAAALTSRTWKDRILGSTKTAAFPNTAVWLASGNNTRLSRELIRRTVWARLDAKVDAPWERSAFRHPNLLGWAKANRGQLVWAALVLCRAWVAAGRPAGTQTLGMFEGWAEVIGGILDVAGVPGLLANAREFRAARADQAGEWRAFTLSWWQEYGERAVGVEELFALATGQKLLDSVLGDKGEKSQRIRLGLALAKAADRIYGAVRIERAGEDHKARQQYRVRRAQADGPRDDRQPTNPSPEEAGEWTA